MNPHKNPWDYPFQPLRDSELERAAQMWADSKNTVEIARALHKRARVLILDEPFKAVDDRNIIGVGKLIETLSQEMGVQMLIVTHKEELKIGKVIQL